MFGYDKCGALTMKRDKKVKCTRIMIENSALTEEIREEGYKYLGIEQRGEIWQTQIKKIAAK